MPGPVGRWLETFMCKQYADTFEAYGFKTLHSVCQLQLPQLQAMGVAQEHCEKILENVHVLRQTLLAGHGKSASPVVQRKSSFDPLINPASLALQSVAMNANTITSKGPANHYPDDSQVGYVQIPNRMTNMAHRHQQENPSMMGISPAMHGYQPPPAHSHGSGYPDPMMQHHHSYPVQEGTYPPAHSNYMGQHFNSPYPNNPYNSGNQGYGGMPSNVPENITSNNSYGPVGQSTVQPAHTHAHQGSLTQSPQQVANNILQMAASSYPPNQTVHVPINKRSAPYHVPRSPHYNMPSQSHSPSQSQMSGHGRQFVYPNSSPHQQLTRTSPISPLHMHSPASHHSGQSLPNSSPGSLHSPQGSVKSPVSIASPVMSGLRSPCGIQQMTSPVVTGQLVQSAPVNQPLHVTVPSSQTSSPQSGVYSSHCSLLAQQQQKQQQQQQQQQQQHHHHQHHSHFSPNPNPSTAASPMSHSGSPYTPGSKTSIHSPQQNLPSYSNPSSVSQYISDHNEEPEQTSATTNFSDPLQSLQKLCMLPETQVVDPKSVVNDGCMPSPQSIEHPKNYESGASPQKAGSSCDTGDNSSSVCEVASGSQVIDDVSVCSDGKHCDGENHVTNTISQMEDSIVLNGSVAKSIIPQNLIEDISEDETDVKNVTNKVSVGSLSVSSDPKNLAFDSPVFNDSFNVTIENGDLVDGQKNTLVEMSHNCAKELTDNCKNRNLTQKVDNYDKVENVLVNGENCNFDTEEILDQHVKNKLISECDSDHKFSSKCVPNINNGDICSDDISIPHKVEPCTEKKECVIQADCTQTNVAKQSKLDSKVSLPILKSATNTATSDSDSSQNDQALIVRKDIYSTYSRKSRASLNSGNIDHLESVEFSDFLTDSDEELSTDCKEKNSGENIDNQNFSENAKNCQNHAADKIDEITQENPKNKSKEKRKVNNDLKKNNTRKKEQDKEHSEVEVNSKNLSLTSSKQNNQIACSSSEEMVSKSESEISSRLCQKRNGSEKFNKANHLTSDSENVPQRSALRKRRASWSKYEDNAFFKGDFILDDEEEKIENRKERKNNCVFLKSSPEKQLKRSEENESKKRHCSGGKCTKDQPVASDGQSSEEKNVCEKSTVPVLLEAIKQEPDNTCVETKTEPLSDSKKKRGRPNDSPNKERKIKAKRSSKVGKRLSKLGKLKKGKNLYNFGAETDSIKQLKLQNTLNMKTKKLTEPSYSSTPYVKIKGSKRHPTSCTVVNQPDEESDLKSVKKKNVTRTVPSLQLSKLPSEKSVFSTSTQLLEEAVWLCALCGKHSSYRFLGDLFGPYAVEGNSSLLSPEESSKSKRKNVLSAGKNGNIQGKKSPKEPRMSVRKRSRSNSSCDSLNLIIAREAWVHEDCVVWSNGVYLIGSKIYGLDESVRVAMTTVCSFCKENGAMVGCLYKGCSQKYHFVCAIEKDCLLDEENFCLWCPKHKDRKIKSTEQSGLKT